jgi:hypothetical protein
MPSGPDPIADFQSIAHAGWVWFAAAGAVLFLASTPLRPIALMIVGAAAVYGLIQAASKPQGKNAVTWFASQYKF